MASLIPGLKNAKWREISKIGLGKFPAFRTSHTVRQIFLFFCGIIVFEFLSTFQLTPLLLKNFHPRLHSYSLRVMQGITKSAFMDKCSNMQSLLHKLFPQRHANHGATKFSLTRHTEGHQRVTNSFLKNRNSSVWFGSASRTLYSKTRNLPSIEFSLQKQTAGSCASHERVPQTHELFGVIRQCVTNTSLKKQMAG